MANKQYCPNSNHHLDLVSRDPEILLGENVNVAASMVAQQAFSSLFLLLGYGYYDNSH